MSFIDGYTLQLKIMSTHLFFYVNFYQILENWQITHEKQSDLQVYFIYFIHYYFKLKVWRGPNDEPRQDVIIGCVELKSEPRAQWQHGLIRISSLFSAAPGPGSAMQKLII